PNTLMQLSRLSLCQHHLATHGRTIQLALLGLSALLLQIEWLYLALKLLGGTYLLYLGIRIWRGAADPVTVPETHVFDKAEKASFLRSFSFAFVTQISNPKTAIVYAGIFAALLPASPPAWMLMVLPPLIFLVEAAWYATVAFAFSAHGPRSIYLKFKHWVDRAAGAIMGGLGLSLMAEGFGLQKS
ncbi:LysE family translocator, partial [Microvirga splendida]